jgi:hypothetical protein
MEVKLKIGFSRYTDNDLSDKSQTIINDMTTNIAVYPNPEPKLVDVQDVKDSFVNAKANKGGKAQTALKNQLRAQLIKLLQTLALYVKGICKNDETMALLSGYDIWKQGSPVGELPKPEDFQLGIGTSPGEIKVSMKSYGTKAKTYMYRYTQTVGADPESGTLLPNCSRVTIISGLISGVKVRVQGAGVGSNKKIVWSDVVESNVL